MKEAIIKLMQDYPQKEGYSATFWTVAMLASALTEKLKVNLSPSSLRGTLHQLGLRWGASPSGDTRQGRPREGTEAVGHCQGGGMSPTGCGHLVCRRISYSTLAFDPCDVASGWSTDSHPYSGNKRGPCVVRGLEYPHGAMDLSRP